MAALHIIGKVRAFFMEHPVEGDLLLAVSGGVDSSAMADIIHQLYSANKCRIGVAHVNFHLRGEDSNSDQEFVRNLAQRYGFEFFTADFDTLKYAKEHKLSVEIAARELRYNWFRELAEKEGFDVLMTAHNADDNAETLLLNLVRGTGRQGLGAIRPYRLIDLSSEKENASKQRRYLRLVRPLLDLAREEIEEYAKENNLQFCIDKTNAQNEYSRNKIRNQVMPLLKEINPSVIRTLSNDISRFRAMNSELDVYVDEFCNKLAVKDCGKNSHFWHHKFASLLSLLSKRFLIRQIPLEDLLRCADFRDFHKASFWLNELFCSLGIVLGESSLNELAKTLFAAATSDTSTRFFVFDECCVTIERGQLRIYDRSLWNLSNIPQVEIKGSGEYDFGLMKIKVEAVDVSPASGLDAQSLIRGGGSAVDADKVNFPLICRTMQEGDRFSPYGLKGSKSVADFLNSRKVDLLFKNIVPVLTKKDGSIVCLPSLEIDDRFKVTSQSQNLLIVSAELIP